MEQQRTPIATYQPLVGDWVYYAFDEHTAYYGEIVSHGDTPDRWRVQLYPRNADDFSDIADLTTHVLCFAGKEAPVEVRLPRKPRIVRERHCLGCGTQIPRRLVGLQEDYCPDCQTGPALPPAGRTTCPQCLGSGLMHWVWAGSPETDDCPLCGACGHVTPDVAAEYVGWHRGAGVA